MIIPVILEDTFEEIQAKTRSIENVAELVQIDFADGVFTDRKSFMDYEKLNELAIENSNLKLEVHLMVSKPMEFLRHKFETVIKVCTQVEAPTDILEFLKKAEEMGYKKGLSLKVETPVEKLEPYIENVDFVQFMSVKLGQQGQKFEQEVLIKIAKFKQKHPTMFVQVDGGLNQENILQLKELGVEGFVVGSSIFGSGNPSEKYIELNNCHE
jgi:ribulose-phosphate 3-epimerase